jgi:hypothetical protein
MLEYTPMMSRTSMLTNDLVSASLDNASPYNTQCNTYVRMHVQDYNPN